MKKKTKHAAEISHDEVTPPMGTVLEEESTDDAPADDDDEGPFDDRYGIPDDKPPAPAEDPEKPTGWDANGSEVTTATVGEIVAAALPDTVDLPNVPRTAAERALSEEERAQIATHGHVLGREQ